MSSKTGTLEPGALWLEVETGRRIRILESMVHGTGPSWTYVDSQGNDVPDSERHPDEYWHYCDVFDFAIWKRFTPLEDEPDVIDEIGDGTAR